MEHEFIESLAEDSLSTFSEVADKAQAQLEAGHASNVDSFANSNPFTSSAHDNLSKIQLANQESLKRLSAEPVIARILTEKEDGEQRTFYITRATAPSLPSGKKLASYRSPIGRLAEIPVGDELPINIQGQETYYTVIEKVSYQPRRDEQGWDSENTQYRHEERGVYGIPSLRAFLREQDVDYSDELEQMLMQEQADHTVIRGISHEVLTAMGLRDQATLDKFQGQIFRLPINNQLVILGPPGTGKTTTLIKRLGQKLDHEALDPEERRLVGHDEQRRPHATSWLMFTPSELLKHYLKEAFSREGVPAPDSHIRTWTNYVNDIGRNSLGILRSTTGGSFSLRKTTQAIMPAVIASPDKWCQSFAAFHQSRLRAQLVTGLAQVATAANDQDEVALARLLALDSVLKKGSLLEIYRELEGQASVLDGILKKEKSTADDLVRGERNRVHNRDRAFFKNLASHIAELKDEEEPDEEDVFDDEEQELQPISAKGSLEEGVRVYGLAIRALARVRYQKRSFAKTSRAGVVIDYLGENLPDQEVLLGLGRSMSLQAGLRRFVNAHKRYISALANSYSAFRKDAGSRSGFYTGTPGDLLGKSITSDELDMLVLATLRNARELLGQSFVSRSLDEPRFSYLVNIADLFRNQVMVDEATDFSPVQLACMESLTSLRTRSFFACGDINQRITSRGIRNRGQLAWVSKSIKIETIQTVYRQSRKLNDFSRALLELQNGDLSTVGEIPEESNHTGCLPALREWADDDEAASWVADRIKEVERSINKAPATSLKFPTIAVLVNSESEVKPMADRLAELLEEVSVPVTACEEGKALGENTAVRVFDVQHIKGLEFEAVFFCGVDKLASENQELFDRYLYVGATRAATYLGLVCSQSLPGKLDSLRTFFAEDFAGLSRLGME